VRRKPISGHFGVLFFGCSLIAMEFQMIFLINTQNKNSIKAPAMDVAYQAAAHRPQKTTSSLASQGDITMYERL